MERSGRPALATFHAPALRGDSISLGEEAAHHARVRRLAVGERVRLTDGAGALAEGEIARLSKSALDVQLDDATVQRIAAPAPVHLLVPVADRERMLWLAEKAAELAVTSWTPVLYTRSRSVSPRGEGPAFADKVRRRMIAALEQSAGAWLPAIESEIEPGEAAARFGGCVRLLLDAAGDTALPVLSAADESGVAIALGPEGGLEASESDDFRKLGWRPAALAPTVLRFETAAIAAVAVARAALMSREPDRPPAPR